MVAQLIVHPQTEALRGGVPLPCDQEILLCRVALAVLSRGTSSFRAPGAQGTLFTMLEALSQFGLVSSWEGELLRIEGQGLLGLRAPDQAIDLRGDAVAGAILLGLVCSRPFASELWVDQVVAETLVPALASAHALCVETLSQGGGSRVACDAVKEGERAEGLQVATHGLFPWVKQAILLAGMRAKSPTVVEERMASSDHLERAMTRARMPLEALGTVLTLHPPRDADAAAPQIYEHIASAELLVPLMSCGLAVPGSELSVRDVAINPTRSDWATLLRLSGAQVGITPEGDFQGEPIGRVALISGKTRACQVSGETAFRLGDGIFYLMAALAGADGTSEFEGLVPRGRGGDERVFGRLFGLMRSAGAEVTEANGRVRVTGSAGSRLKPLRVTTGGDARLALVATILGLMGSGTSTIDNVDCLRHVFPRWVGTLRALGAQLEVKSV